MLAEFAYQGFTKEKFFPLPFFHRVPAISESFKTSRYIVCVTIHPVIASPCMSVVPPPVVVAQEVCCEAGLTVLLASTDQLYTPCIQFAAQAV